MRRAPRRGYTPLPPHLAHLDPPRVVALGAEMPLPGWAPIETKHGTTYYAGMQEATRYNEQLWLLAKELPHGIKPIRWYYFREHFNEAVRMLRAGATEEEIMSYEHTS